MKTILFAGMEWADRHQRAYLAAALVVIVVGMVLSDYIGGAP